LRQWLLSINIIEVNCYCGVFIKHVWLQLHGLQLGLKRLRILLFFFDKLFLSCYFVLVCLYESHQLLLFFQHLLLLLNLQVLFLRNYSFWEILLFLDLFFQLFDMRLILTIKRVWNIKFSINFLYFLLEILFLLI
jgi:hypothetical protein